MLIPLCNAAAHFSLSRRYFSFLALMWFFFPFPNGLNGQTTEGAIFGRVTDDRTGERIDAAIVSAVHLDTGRTFETRTSFGFYVLVRLPPGGYRLSVDGGDAYRLSRVENLELSVAGFVEQNLPLRSLKDLWQQGLVRSVIARDQRTVLRFYGPDVDLSRSIAIESATTISGTLEPTISTVVNAQLISTLPLAGRDAYELLTFVPGVLGGLASLRGPSVSVNGQRASSSNFLLDGVENNNYLITGPFSPLPPEAVEQFRVSTTNFSAEYGRTSGYIANAITYRGTNEWHGLFFLYGQNDFLNANAPDRQSAGLARQLFQAWQGGGRDTGHLIRRVLFHSEVLDWLTARTRGDPRQFILPGDGMISQVTAAASRAALSFRTPTGGTQNADGSRTLFLQQPYVLDQFDGVERLDWEPSAIQHLTGRVGVSRQSVPDFIWSPYPNFVSPLHQNNVNTALAYVRSFNSALSMELRGAYNRDALNWERQHNDLPRLEVLGSAVVLPGSPANFDLTNAGGTVDLHGNVIYTRGTSVLKAGAGFISRKITGRISVLNAEPTLSFSGWTAFAKGQPGSILLPESYEALLNGVYQSPDTNRDYSYLQTFFFLQDSIRLSPRFLLHAGIRYDLFGAPSNDGNTNDWTVQPGSGTTLTQRISTATLVPLKAGESLFAQDNNDWAPRVGFAWNVTQKGDMIVRGAYGLYYDRPFDNLWLNLRFNNTLPITVDFVPDNQSPAKYDVSSLIASASMNRLFPVFPDFGLTFYQPHIRTPYVQSYFLSIERRFTESLLLALNYAGSQGRKLLTTDRINRPGCADGDDACRPNPNLQTDIDYRANQGNSSFNSLSATVRWHHRQSQAQLNYTWSHAIDNQSDPLQGLLGSNLEVTNVTGGAISPRPAAFTEEYSNSADRGNADFDQRQSLTGLFSWVVPKVNATRAVKWLHNWTLSAVGVIRSGTPYSIYNPETDYPFFYNRPNLITEPVEFAKQAPVAGGRRLINPEAFAASSSALGTVGRNALIGPGFYDADVSIARDFAIPRGKESMRLLIRADAYNVFNHPNLSNPNVVDASAFVGSPNFGVATYGRPSESGGALSFIPLSGSSRQLQLMLRFSF